MSYEPDESLEQQLASYQQAGRSESPRRRDDARNGPGWTRFAAAAGASLAAATNADATIQHIVPNPPVRVDIESGPYNAVANVDGLPGNDLAIRFNATYDSFLRGTRIFGYGYGVGGATLIGDNYGYFGSVTVRRLNSGDAIPAATPARVGSMLYNSVTSAGVPFTYNGQFGAYAGTTTGFAGFVNDVGGALHAGWVRIRTEPYIDGFGNPRLRAIQLVDWAYEDVAGVDIRAGQLVSDPMGLPGDYTEDNVVDAADYTVWRDRVGTVDTLPNDPDGGTIGTAQYNTWVNNFGATAGAASAAPGNAGAVPEPSAISLGVLALGAAGVAALRRRAERNSRD